MNTQLESTTQAISRAHQDKAFNQTMLSQQEATWKAQQTGLQNPDSLQQQMATLQDQLAALLSKYTPEHPDVIKLKSQIEELKKRLAADPGTKDASETPAPSFREPGPIQELRAKIKQDDLNIAELTKRQSEIQDQIRTLQGRIQASPVVEQQFKELTRNYQTASEIYNELLKKRENSAMATTLEHQQESETFKVLDPPSLPVKPSYPSIIKFVAGGAGAGLALALATLYLLAFTDKAMYSERDIELSLKLPVLAMVPSFDVSAHRGYRHPDQPLKGSSRLATRV